ncbi:MAG: GNAT family N-acetyltransferase [Actinomycetota bacterium]|nr:GNAT family N-acetyltransferase [Actinomycetota bacterium]
MRERGATFETRLRDPAAVSEAIAHWLLCLVFVRDDEVLGFAKAAPYEDRSRYYDGIGEATIFVEREARGERIGGALLAALADSARARGLHKLTAKIFASNAASVRLFEACGFRVVGTHLRHGELDGDWRDVVLVERSLR